MRPQSLSLVPWLLLAPLAGAAELVPSPERPGASTDDPILRPRDLSGRSIKGRRVRAVHSTDPALEGTTAHLFERDPWLAYQRGRELFLREFSAADGAFGEPGKLAGPLLEDQVTRLANRDHVASCALCHNVPFRDGGAGATFFKNGGSGRNTMHLFGVGLIEMLGQQLRRKLLALGDRNADGWIALGEADGLRAVVDNLPAGIEGERHRIDFGGFGDQDGDGRPDLNSVCLVWYVDAAGRRISWARRLDEPGVAGYSFEVQLLGWGHRKGSVASTIRAFTANAFDLHTGLQAYDPTLNEEPAGDGLALVSLAGAQQFWTGRTRDRGGVKDRNGVSLDDPDRDGVPEELTQGDLDLAEFYQLNHPAPAERSRTPQRRRGREIFGKLGCVRCHVPDWHLETDRRFFDLRIAPDPDTGRLQGRLVRLDRTDPRPFTIRGVYSDFTHHDLGPAFHQVQFDGSRVTRFRTAPLWGVGSSAPYGHDGASLDLDEVIRRHGGEAGAEQQAYTSLSDEDRAALIEFLRGLVLYSVDDLPCDLDGDGRIAESFVVAGQDTGIERLNPEWLFRVPGRIEGRVLAPDGAAVRSFALTNVEEAYGAHLEWLADRNHDGLPDARVPPGPAPGR
jgi:hypothetical protein